jgi:predicted esterase YcpF (UPF0227 family)
MHFLYIHGFNSSPQSLKGQQLIRHFDSMGQSSQLSVPALSHWPSVAMQQLETIVQQHDELLLIGSSLGGFYATNLSERYSHVKAVLVNPAVAPHHLLGALLGPQKNFYSGEEYELTLEHMAQLERLYYPQLSYPERLLLMQQEGDETLDYREAVSYYKESSQIVQPGGHHGFENFESMLPTIFAFAENRWQPENS